MSGFSLANPHTLEVSEQIQLFKEIILAHESEVSTQIAHGHPFITLDFARILEASYELAQLLLEHPEDVIRAAELALESLDFPGETKNFRVRITNLPRTQELLIQNVRSKHLGTLLLIEGIVKNKSDVRPQIVSARFECPSCGTVQPEFITEDTFRPPALCKSCGYRGKLKLLSKDLVDAQAMVIEDIPEKLESGQQPKRINVLLKEDLVSPLSDLRTNPGSKIRISGYIKEVPITTRTGGKSTRFEYLFEANHVEPTEENFFMLEFSDEEVAEICALAERNDVYDLLIRAIAPSIYGHDRIKEALVLQMLGGLDKQRADSVRSRGDVHILLVGDPGSGKSQLLKRASKVAPKSRYVSGKGASGAGLTASVVRNDFLGGFSLEAGALVLANKGMCLIDEMDKMSTEDTSAMHEALEQQSYHPDFEIQLSDGSTRRIGLLVDEQFERHPERERHGIDCEIIEGPELSITRFDPHTFEVTDRPVTRVSRHRAPDTLIKITYANGETIKVTPEHPVMVLTERGLEEIPAEHVTSGMIAPFRFHDPTTVRIRSARCGDREVLIDDDIGSLFGIIASEGHSSRNETHRTREVGFSNTNRNVAERFERICRTRLGDGSMSIRTKGRANPLYVVRMTKHDTYHFFDDQAPELLRTAKHKRVPDTIKRSPRTVREAFVSSFFTGDGFVDSNRVGLCTSSARLATDLRSLLTSLEIYSYEAVDNDFFKIVVSGADSIERFVALVDRSDARKMRCESILRRARAKRNDRDRLPGWAAAAMRHVLKTLRIDSGYYLQSLHSNGTVHRATLRASLERVRERIDTIRTLTESAETESLIRAARLAGYDRSQLNAFAQVPTSTTHHLPACVHAQVRLREAAVSCATTRIARLEPIIASFDRILDPKMRFVPITRTRRIPADCAWVYDVTVEPESLFVTNGLVLHNTISISKANIQATLPSQTTVLAAANPKYGRFDSYQNIYNQIDMPPALISRFDLIFIVRDVADQKNDEKMAAHILDLHANPEELEMPLPDLFLRKFFAYAKQHIRPKLTQTARDEISRYYVKMRSQASSQEGVRSIPLTARQLEALVRLAEASARVRLSEHVTKQDAERAINLLHYCLTQVAADETGQIDIDRITSGVPSSQRSRIYTVKKIIEELESEIGNKIPKTDITTRAAEKNISATELDEILTKLVRSGDLYEPTSGTYSKLS
jgi:replicative DNA helicase Mcm